MPLAYTTELLASLVAACVLLPGMSSEQFPRTVCRGVGSPLTVREEHSWIDVAFINETSSCERICDAFHPRYERIGVCYIQKSSLAEARASEIRKTLCGCHPFSNDEPSVPNELSQHKVCRCGTPQAALKLPIPTYDAIRDLGSVNDWTEADASFWWDSDGFDMPAIREPVRDGHCDTTDACEDQELHRPDNVQTLSTDPRLYLYPSFLSAEEVNALRELVRSCS